MADEMMNWGALYDSAGEADKPLPNGPYNVEVTKAEAKTTKNGKPMFSLSAKVLDGPHAGRFVWHNLTVTVENPNAMRMFFLNMAAFGLGDDVVHQLIASNAGNILHAGANFGGVATKSAVSAVAVERKHVHIAVVVGLVAVGQGLQKLLSRGTAAQRYGAFDQRCRLVCRALLQPKIRHRAR